jgi:hypothetical protein
LGVGWTKHLGTSVLLGETALGPPAENDDERTTGESAEEYAFQKMEWKA